MIYPMVEYAKSINKNTADLTSSDMVNFTKWWMKQPQREDIIMAIKAQQKRATQVGKYLQTIKQEDNIMENEQTENEVVCTMELTKADVDAL